MAKGTSASRLSEQEILNQAFDPATGTLDIDIPNQNELDYFVQSNYPGIRYAYKDDFSLGFQGWQSQYSTLSFGGITLSEECRYGNYGLEIHSRGAASAEAWARKGMVIPTNAKKIIYGCYWSMHGGNVNSPERVKFEIDMETNAGTRKFFSVSYVNYLGSFLQKWQVNTGASATYSDVTDGAQKIPWNEGMKPMINSLVVVVDWENYTYDKLYSNGQTWDISALAPGTGVDLNNFENGLVNIYAVKNRSDNSEEGNLILEKPFLGYTF